MNAIVRPRLPLAALVNAGLVLLLLLLAAAMLAWQWPALAWRPPAPNRWALAAALVAAWAGMVLLLRVRERQRVQRRDERQGAWTAAEAPGWLVLHASQTGYAEQLAWQTADSLRAADAAVRVASLEDLDPAALRSSARALIVASTTGEGDAPDSAIAFMRRALGAGADLSGLRYGLLALGDRNYANFCGFGRRLHGSLRAAGAEALFDPVEVDNGAADALRLWQHRLAVLTGAGEQPDWEAPRYRRWRLVERRLLNAGCEGGPCFHVALVAVHPADAFWEAGDIAEIGPRNAPNQVAAWLEASGFNGATRVDDADGASLYECLSRSHLPAAEAGLDPATLVGRLQALPHREYSIASLPADGAVHLLLRQLRRPDGELGIGCGWLTEWAPLGAEIDLRIRRNRNFHVPPDGRPMILIGNGTGIAGLRSLLKARVAAGHRANWLLFGERHAASDCHYGEDIEAWQRDGFLQRLDLVYSRDSTEREYVQDRLRRAASTLRAWVAEGASIYVCGSLEGMAGGVDRVLREELGTDAVGQLTAARRYRRDVY